MSHPSGPHLTSVPFEPLIGANGMTYVSETLSSEHPQVAIRKIQRRTSMQNPLCEPLLGLVDELGITHADAHRAVLAAAKQALLALISSHQDKAKLERLLNASFHYLGIQELREIPLAVMNTLEMVPPVFLKQLTGDKEIFKELPVKVQRQAWEFDKNLLQQDALPPVGQYKYEVATVMRAMAMDEFLPPLLRGGGGGGADGGDGIGGGGSGTRHLGITRKILRKGSRVLQLLKGMVGSSHKIYTQIVELCVVKFRDAETLYLGARELSYCTLRAQLLMTLHDDSCAVAAKDRCHELAWTLDAGIMHGRLTDKHLAKLEKYFEDVDATERAAAKLSSGSRKRGLQDEAESAGNVSIPLGEPYKVLGDAGTILADPSCMHLLLATCLNVVITAAARRDPAPALPRDVPMARFLLRLLQLAVDTRRMLRERKYRLPEPEPRALHDVLPLLAALAVQHELSPSPGLDGLPPDVKDYGVDKAAVQAALAAIPVSEVSRRLCQIFVLERLMRDDYLSAVRVLRLLAQATASKAMYEAFDFACSLAQRLAELVKARKLGPGNVLWSYAVDNFLVKAVDSHMQVHEEVLRLLLAVAPQLSPQQLGEYLRMTLDNSRKSRKRSGKKRDGDPLADFPMSLMGELSDIGSDGWPGILALKSRSSDSVKSMYVQFKAVRGMDRDAAPELFEYLDEDRKQREAAAAAAAADAEVARAAAAEVAASAAEAAEAEVAAAAAEAGGDDGGDEEAGAGSAGSPGPGGDEEIRDAGPQEMRDAGPQGGEEGAGGGSAAGGDGGAFSPGAGGDG